MPDMPVYKVVDGVFVRIEGDIRDPVRRYSQVVDLERGEYLLEFSDEQEREFDEREARWIAEAPQRAIEQKRQQEEHEKFRSSLVYDRRIVAFLDILGWTSAIRTSNTTPLRTQELGLALSLLKKYARFVEETSEMRGAHGAHEDGQDDLHVTHFSDCVVVSVTPDNSGLHRLIATLETLSIGLLHQGFLLRGGITIGDIYHRGTMVFGPAFLKAYELESHSAIYPRIILDPVLAHSWGEGISILDKEGHKIGQAKTWRLSDDGFRFFDFLQPFGGMPDFSNSVGLFARNIDPLRKLLERNLSEYRDNFGVWQKYAWLANYFNDVCAEHAGHGFDPIHVDS